MVVIAGCLIVRDGKILMVKEAKKHVMDNGISQQDMQSTVYLKEKEIAIIIKFIADIIEENIKFDTDVQE